MKLSLFAPAFLLTLTLYGQQFNSLTYQDLRNFDLLKEDTSTQLSLRPTITYESGEYFTVLAPESGLSYNSKYPRSYNDGPIWQGKGITAQLNGGFQWKKKLLNITAFPVVYFSQNSEYRLASIRNDRNPYNYQFSITTSNIDFTQRYGAESFVRFHPGQSEIALRSEIIEVSLSTQNFILGPARYQSIMMSNGGSGFPHLSMGTSRPVNIEHNGIDFGSIDGHLFFGLLSESDYFDTLASNDQRYLNAFSIGYRLPKLESITIGVNRVLYKDTQFFQGNDLYSLFYNNEGTAMLDTFATNDSFDQMFSLFFDWKLPDQDFRFFFELVKNDFNGSPRNFLEEFEHSRAYSIGLEKIYALKKRDLHIYFEGTHLMRPATYQYRAGQSYYTHEWAKQGYTQGGQLLGAGIGPGSNSEFLSLNLHDDTGYLGINFQRIRFNEDYFNEVLPPVGEKWDLHDVEYTLGIKRLKKLSYFDLMASGALSCRLNMYNVKGNDKVNLWLNVVVRVPVSK